MKNSYIKSVESEFILHKNSEKSIGQKAYMKDKFEFVGLTSPIRKELQKVFLLKSNLPPKEDIKGIITYFWNKPEREFQYFAQELFQKYCKQFEKSDIDLFEFMIINKSWWDTVGLYCE